MIIPITIKNGIRVDSKKAGNAGIAIIRSASIARLKITQPVPNVEQSEKLRKTDVVHWVSFPASARYGG